MRERGKQWEINLHWFEFWSEKQILQKSTRWSPALLRKGQTESSFLFSTVMLKLEIRRIQRELMEKRPQANLDAEPVWLLLLPVPWILQASCWLLKKGCVSSQARWQQGFEDAFTSWSLPAASDSKGNSPAGVGVRPGLRYSIFIAPLCPTLQAWAVWRNELGQDLWWAVIYHAKNWNQTNQVRRQKGGKQTNEPG